MGMAIEYDPCIKCEANMCSMCKLRKLEHDAALAKKIFEEIEINIFKLETPYQTLHCIPRGFIEEIKEKYTKGGEE